MPYAHPIPADLNATVAHALAEDIGTGDITAQLVAPNTQAHAQVISRDSATIAGFAWFEACFLQLDPSIKIDWRVKEGDDIAAYQTLCHIEGNARILLTAERPALNFLQTLSATSTQVQQAVDLVSDTGVTLLDTRKTLPGLRQAQKYAVLCGGGKNHRMGLYDAFLIKENHISAAGSITKAIKQARQIAPDKAVQTEVENIKQLKDALSVDVDSVLLDNFSIEQLREAVKLCAGRCKLEASGGVDAKTLRQIAETGVDYISLGSFTKHIHAVDLSMRLSL